MKQDTKEVLNAIIDVLALQMQALEKMNEAVKAAEHRVAELMEALDENTDQLAELRGEVAMLPKEGTIIGDKWPYGIPPYTPYYPQPIPTWTVNNEPVTWDKAFPQS